MCDSQTLSSASPCALMLAYRGGGKRALFLCCIVNRHRHIAFLRHVVTMADGGPLVSFIIFHRYRIVASFGIYASFGISLSCFSA